jgi:flagellar export protein FliJ
MKRYHFNLRPVAVIRSHQKQRARESWAAGVRLYDEAAAKLARVRARKAEFETALLAGRQVRFDAAAAAPALVAYRGVCTDEAEAVKETNAAHLLMIERRTAYINAHRRLEIVRKLEAKAQLAHREAAQRVEQAEFDDFAGRSAFRKLLVA